MPTTLVNIETAHRDQVEPNVRAYLLPRPGQGRRQEDRRYALCRAAALLRRRPRTVSSYSDPLFGRPDIVENDYYRFRQQPRG